MSRDLSAVFESHAAYLAGQIPGDKADFGGQSLHGQDFSGRDLREASFINADLRGANFSRTNLSDTDFSGADARGADFSHADLTNANTSEAQMQGADFTGAKVDYDNLNLGVRRQSSGGPDTLSVGFPHLWMYSGTDSAGFPFVTSPGVFDQSLIDAQARFHLFTLSAYSLARPDIPFNYTIVNALRGSKNARAGMVILWYQLVQEVFLSVTTTLPGAIWSILQGLEPGGPGVDRRLYYDAGHGSGQFPTPPTAVSWDPSGGYATNGTSGVTALANAWKSYCMGRADGYFFDTFKSIFTFPAGCSPGLYANVPVLDAAVDAASATFNNLMVGTGRIWGNRGMNLLSDPIAFKWNGELYENWDTGQGTADTSPPLGSANYDAALAACAHWESAGPTAAGTQLLFEQMPNGTYDTAAWRKCQRYVTGSACLLGGYSSLGNTVAGSAVHDCKQWADEYSVLPGGASDPSESAATMGWLGMPIEMKWKDAGGCWVRRFQRGVVIVNGDGPGGAHSITLERPYKRIAGIHDPSVNDGSTVTTLSVPAKDARFLLRTP